MTSSVPGTGTPQRPVPGSPVPGSPAPGGPVLLVVAGGAVSQAAIARTAELAAGAPVTVVGVGTSETSRTSPCPSRPRHPAHAAGDAPEQVRRTVALAMSVLESAGVMAAGHIAVTGSPARAVARMARASGARAVILDQSGTSGTVSLMADLRRRMHGSGVVVLAETDRRRGWVSA